ncbi:MAG: acyl-ACP--UDP-N-acetylglucosamine O-acyltransferase [Lentisphaeraceae bacterium]|nr:acyl-ACP--UDP-N-acetylglucosamine O-acyltransferase [Lentisphaeraceae bacterium]
MIHESAVISKDAKLGENVSVGPFSVIDENVVIGDNCVIGPSVHITGHTEIGADCKIHKGAVVGDEPQDISYSGFTAYTKIGAGTVIREYATIHRGSKPEAATVIGENCMLMAFSHVAHDCQFGDRVIIANNTIVAGHVEIDSKAIVSGNVAIHQFCKIGSMAMVGGYSKINQDIPPFSLVDHDSHIVSLNAIGMKRNGIDSKERKIIRDAFKQIFMSGRQRKEVIEEFYEQHSDLPSVKYYLDFIKASKRGIQAVLKS